MTLPKLGALLVAVLASVVLLASCSGQTTASPRQQQTQAQVDENTAALRALKKQAGVEACPSPGGHGPVAGGMPQVTLPCLGGGNPVDLAKLRGPLVVNLFAQWCGPCRAELPYYQKLHEAGRGKVAVLGIDYQDTQPAGALQLAKATGVTYPLLADPTAQLRVPFRVRGLPGVVLVDAHGRVVHEELTEVSSYQQLRQLVQRYLHVAL
jgi:thiol-disulfide isomerase/thioredoxin